MLAALERSVEEPAFKQDKRFGDLLRFWRTAFGLSQETLAERADISVRHLSFLENGRTRPSPAAIEKLGGGLGLGARERTMLALAAGCAPPLGDDGSLRPLADDWRLILRSADPAPASVMSRFGRVLAVNRGWVALHRAHLGSIVEAESLNAVDLLLHPQGWRRFVKDWTLIASVMLAIIKQEAALHEDEAALRDVDRWAKTPGLPRDWPVIGARLSETVTGYSYTISPRDEGGPRFRIVHSTLGYFSADQPRALILQSAYPQSGPLPLIPASQPPHPLCPF